jgi:release factor glutamine methyltransferase
MNLKEAISFSTTELSDFYPKEEIQSFIYLIFNELENLSKPEIHIQQDFQISENSIHRLKKIVLKLKEYQPLQYIFGKTEFYDLTFSVNKDVLIPRPETEELVDWIVNDSKNTASKIIDIGTGSGCIAISLKKSLPKVKILAIDISKKALEIAKKNAQSNNAEISFTKFNILDIETNKRFAKFDIIVSNPPYVREQEKSLMAKNVLNFEPYEALFVSNQDPLIFYEAIANFAIKHLSTNGNLYLEINENLAEQTAELLSQKGFCEILIKKDINDKFRMIRAKLLN